MLEDINLKHNGEGSVECESTSNRKSEWTVSRRFTIEQMG